MNILITDVYEVSEEIKAWLESRGLTLLRCPDEDFYSGDPSKVDIIACKMLFSHTPIELFTNLKYIQLFMAGYDHIPMDYIEAHGIEFHNARDVFSIPIAEFGIGGVLMLYKEMRAFERDRTRRVWEPRRFLREMTDRHVVIAGAGSIGTEFARRFRAFGCRVTGLARSGRVMEYYDRVLPMAAMDEVLPDADILVLCLPNNDETRHIIDARRLALMKHDAVLVNIARGALIDESALVTALQRGELGGAVLDVFETEPLPAESPLWEMDNVIVAPHTSFGAEYNERRIFEVLCRNLEKSDILTC